MAGKPGQRPDRPRYLGVENRRQAYQRTTNSRHGVGRYPGRLQQPGEPECERVVKVAVEGVLELRPAPGVGSPATLGGTDGRNGARRHAAPSIVAGRLSRDRHRCSRNENYPHRRRGCKQVEPDDRNAGQDEHDIKECAEIAAGAQRRQGNQALGDRMRKTAAIAIFHAVEADRSTLSERSAADHGQADQEQRPGPTSPKAGHRSRHEARD